MSALYSETGIAKAKRPRISAGRSWKKPSTNSKIKQSSRSKAKNRRVSKSLREQMLCWMSGRNKKLV